MSSKLGQALGHTAQPNNVLSLDESTDDGPVWSDVTEEPLLAECRYR